MKFWLKDKIKGLYPNIDFDILIPPNTEMGDYSINLAFMLAKKEGKTPIETGEELARKFSGDKDFKKYFEKIEFVRPGFVNFYLDEDFLRSQVLKILEEKERYSSGDKKNISINLEFVSANPVGPVTVHNIRAAPYGDALAKILKRAGYEVTKEYYINDAGNQVRLLGESVARRYLRFKGKTIDFPENMYQGEYIVDIAKEVDGGGVAGDIENFDELVNICKEYAVKKLIDSIKNSLKDIGVEFDVWFSEKKLHESGEIESALKILDKGKHVYDKDGARWLKLDETGENDAVLVKSDGTYSYLMGDIAYTRNKFIRGFKRAVNIWGADHHGDVPRLMGGVASLNYEREKLEILLHQLVSIKNGGEKQRMSKRKGIFVLLDELLKEVSRDAIRFFFLMKDLNTHMEFDVELAKEQSNKNPVFYIQYAFARLNSIFDKLRITDYGLINNSEFVIDNLKEPEELLLMRKMVRLPELIDDISKNYQVHHLAQYAYELASLFHNFYEKHRVVQLALPVGGDNKNLEKNRVALCRAVAVILGDCLNLMGLGAPKRMENKEHKGSQGVH